MVYAWLLLINLHPFIKLAYKLRGVRAVAPKPIEFPEYDKYIKALADEAQKYNFDTAYYNLTSMLAKRGSLNAETAIGIMLMEGKGCQKDVQRGKASLELSVSHGSASAAIYLGEECIRGTNIKADPDGAMKWFTKAANLGYTDAYEKMGDIYRDGVITEKNIAKAIELYDLAAVGNNASAKAKSDKLKATRVDFYLEGYKIINSKVPVTSDEAFSAFRSFAISTAMGEARAPRYLAKCYAYGFGTEKSRSSAFFWFKHAVECGDKEAYLPLALCYSNGFGINFSFKNSIKYLKLAESIGARGASAELDRLYRRKMKKMVRQLYSLSMRLIHQKKFNEAVRMLTSFEAIAYPPALYTLGCLYEFGRGVEKCDRKKADKYYELAASGNPAFGSFTDPVSKYKLIVLKMIR